MEGNIESVGWGKGRELRRRSTQKVVKTTIEERTLRRGKNWCKGLKKRTKTEVRTVKKTEMRGRKVTRERERERDLWQSERNKKNIITERKGGRGTDNGNIKLWVEQGSKRERICQRKRTSKQLFSSYSSFLCLCDITFMSFLLVLFSYCPNFSIEPRETLHWRFFFPLRSLKEVTTYVITFFLLRNSEKGKVQ